MRAPDPPVPTHRMTADEFLAWALEQEGRYELEDGFVITLSSERAAHARVKARAHRQLEDAIARHGLRCEAFPDGMAVQVDVGIVFEPDALVRCGDPVPNDTVRLTDPMIVVEVTSPSTGWRDATAKLAAYFRLPSLRHYLIASPAGRTLVHYHRPEGSPDIAVRILGNGPLRLDPPGLELDVAALFANL